MNKKLTSSNFQLLTFSIFVKINFKTMALRYKLAFYLFGLLIGFYFVGEFLTAKAESRGVQFCYFPNCRVIKDIRSKPFQTSAAVDSLFAKKVTSKKEINEAISNGDVDFSKSNVPYK